MTSRGNAHQRAVYGVIALGAVACALLGSGASRWAALAGVLLAGFTSLFALFMKGWAVRRNLDAAMLTVGATFGLRLFLAGAGVAVSAVTAQAAPAFVIGFFAAFFPLQVIEIFYVLSAHKAAAQRSAA